MFKFYKREHECPLIYPSPVPPVCCLLGYNVTMSETLSLTSLEKGETFTVSMAVKGIIEMPYQVAARPCKILILLHQIVTHGIL